MTPGVCLVGTLFLLQLASLCPSFALAKASRPTNNKVSGKTALRDTDCTGGADEFSFGQDGRDLTTSQADPSKMYKFCGEAGKLATSRHRIQSVVCNVVLSLYLKA